MIGINTAKELGASTSIGAVMAGLLAMPGLADITLFGEKLQPNSGDSFGLNGGGIFFKIRAMVSQYCKRES